ncbi:S-layer homology domain-containing protein, partial [Paenibacillus sepulcri]|nr:S-layer homology domain-containing protein [Paenibacillus sepulcri]
PAPAPAPAPAPETSPFSSSVVNKEQLFASIQETLAANKDAKVSFTDTASHWAANDIALAMRLQIIAGYQDGSFKPNASVSRAEFSAMIARAFHMTAGSSQVSFSDIGEQSWSTSYIEILASNGIIGGYQDGTFKPGQEITRAEMLTIISRILNLKQMSHEGPASSFKDVNSGYWAQKTIGDATAAGLVQGIGTDKFAPDSKATRAEALSLIVRSLKTDRSIEELLQ